MTRRPLVLFGTEFCSRRYIGDSAEEPPVAVPLHTRSQQRANVTTDVAIILAVVGGRQLPQLVLPVFPGWVELVRRNVLRKDSAKTQQ